jgi:hypothetical protein
VQEDELRNAILVVLANKQDIPGCMSVPDVHRALGLDALKTRTFQIFKTSAVKGDGMDEAMEWSVLQTNYTRVEFLMLTAVARFTKSKTLLANNSFLYAGCRQHCNNENNLTMPYNPVIRQNVVHVMSVCIYRVSRYVIIKPSPCVVKFVGRTLVS